MRPADQGATDCGTIPPREPAASAQVSGSQRRAIGVDGMKTKDLGAHLREHWPTYRKQLLGEPTARSPSGTSNSRSETEQKTAARDSHRAAPLHPASRAENAHAHLRPALLRVQLRLLTSI